MSLKNRVKSISKSLSRNDTGETGAHQVGILVPKDSKILSFFPTLATRIKNPRAMIRFQDEKGSPWDFVFIYYNNKFFDGTRNEYRLTRMTEFIRVHSLRAGDELILTRDDDDITFRIAFTRKNAVQKTTEGVLRLGSEWRIIQFGD
jgi:hypothetical protein